CKAIVLARSGEGWDTVLAVLQAARDAYDAGDAGPESPGWNPYARVNCLQLDALTGNVPVDGAQVAACLRAARTRFTSRYDFFDGAMAGDASVANWLSTGRLPEIEDDLPYDGAAEALARTYRDAIQGLPQTPRQMESVVSQLVFLAELLCLRNAKDDQARSEAL